jgi:Ca-activated chloride channel family protein
VHPFRALGTTWATRTRFIPPLLRSLAVVALIVALARPQSGGEYRDTSEGIAIQMVLDVSGSMAEEDFVIDGRRARRLDAVKEVFEDFVMGRGSLGGRENDLIGMTTFAMYADTPCPLTLDHGSLRDLLKATEIPGWIDGRQVRQDIESDNTSLGDAIVVATDVLRRAGEQAVAGIPGAEAAKSRVMILLTDGADNPPDFAKRTAPDPVEAARVAATLGIKVYTIGAVGSDQARRRGPFGLFSARAQVDEPTLQEIARVTGGKYFRATDTKSLVTIYDEIDKLERRTTGERAFRDNVYAAKVAMLAGLGLLMLEMLLVNTRYRKLP